jgi:ABC-2 type transport system permease protein
VNPVRLIAIARKEFRQLTRDWRTLFILVFLPAILLLVFGYALSFDVKNVPIAVLDHDRSPESRDVVRALLGAESFALVGVLESHDEVAGMLDGGHADAVVVIPPGFGRAVVSNEGATVQALLDGSNSQKAATSLGYLNAHFSTFALEVVTGQVERAGFEVPDPPLTAVPRIWYNPELRSSMFLVPGLMVFVLMISATISTALSVVRERERNTIEQVLVSPVRAPELILGKTAPYLVVSMLAAALLVAVGWVLFGVEVRGSLWLLGLLSFIFCLAALGQGLLISSVTDSQQVAFFAAVITTMLPTFLLSGFVFPLASMPVVIQVISYAVPARYFVSLVRGVILRGAGLADVWQPLLSLSVFSIVILALASVRASRIRL